MTNPNPNTQPAIYEAAEIEIVEVDNADIICTSGNGGIDPEGNGPDATW